MNIIILPIDLPRTILSREANMRQLRILPQGNWLWFRYHGCHSQGFLKFPDFFLTNVKFPRPTELTISHIRTDDGLNPPLATISSTYLFMLSASQVQCTSGFSVAFGSTGCGGLAGRLMPRRHVECQSQKLLGGSGGHTF